MAVKYKLKKMLIAAVSVGLLVAGCSKQPNADFQNLAVSKGYEVLPATENAPEFLEKMSYSDEKIETENYETLVLGPIEHIEDGYFAQKINEKGKVTGMYIKFDSVRYAAISYYAQMRYSIFRSDQYGFKTNYTDITNVADKITITIFANTEEQAEKDGGYCYAVGLKPEDNAVIASTWSPNEDASSNLATPEERMEYVLSELESLGLKEYSEEPWMALVQED